MDETTDDVNSIGHRALSSFALPKSIFPHLASGWYTELTKSMQRIYFPFYTGNKTFTDSDFLLNSGKKLNHSSIKAMQIQLLMTETGVVALQKLAAALNKDGDNEKTTRNWHEIYNLWSEINEKEFNDLFHTKQFVLLQESLLKIQNELMKKSEQGLANFGLSNHGADPNLIREIKDERNGAKKDGAKYQKA